MPLSKRFNRYRKDLGVHKQDEGKRQSRVDFHSFRRWFITMAEQADIPPHIIESVVGHKRQGMTLGSCSGGAAIKQMKKCVEAVRLPKSRA
jgi:integrase